MRPRVRRLLAWVTVAVAAAVAAAGIWWIVDGGRYLQHEDRLRKADAIFVLGGTRMERPLEAVELYREGWAPVIALSPGRIEPAEELARARGASLPSDAALVRISHAPRRLRHAPRRAGQRPRHRRSSDPLRSVRPGTVVAPARRSSLRDLRMGKADRV